MRTVGGHPVERVMLTSSGSCVGGRMFFSGLNRKFKTKLLLRHWQETHRGDDLEGFLSDKYARAGVDATKSGLVAAGGGAVDLKMMAAKAPMPVRTALGTGALRPSKSRIRIQRQAARLPLRKRLKVEIRGKAKRGRKEKVLRPDGTMGHASIEPAKIAALLNHEADREKVQLESGFSHNYIMKLQRKVLRETEELQLRAPTELTLDAEHKIHVLWDAENKPLFIKKELCLALQLKGTTFSYWKKKAGVGETDTSTDFRLMDKCRSIFGGRSTYTLYTAADLWAILMAMERSRQRHHFLTLGAVKALVQPYCLPKA